MAHNAPKVVSWGLSWVHMMVHIRDRCIPMSRKILSIQQKTCNDIHAFYRAQVEHFFAHL